MNFCWQKSNFRTFETKNKRSDEKLYFFAEKWRRRQRAANRWWFRLPSWFWQLPWLSKRLNLLCPPRSNRVSLEHQTLFHSHRWLFAGGPIFQFQFIWSAELSFSREKRINSIFFFVCVFRTPVASARHPPNQPTNPKSVAYLIPVRRARQRINTVFIT